LAVKVVPSDIQNFEEMKGIVKDLLSGSESPNISGKE
jgi:hypothetical protein